MKLIRDQVKTIDTGIMFRRWEVISMNSHDLLFTKIAPPPQQRTIEISKQLWRNEALFTEITWLWQFDTRSEPLFRNKWFAKVSKLHEAAITIVMSRRV